IVGASHHAGAAANAGVAVQIDDAVAATVERVGRTDPRAGRVVALVAEDGEKESASVGEGAFLDGLDPTAIDTDRNLVLGFAGDRARVTPDALAKIDGEPVVGHARSRIYHAALQATESQRHRAEAVRRTTDRRSRSGTDQEHSTKNAKNEYSGLCVFR